MFCKKPSRHYCNVMVLYSSNGQRQSTEKEEEGVSSLVKNKPPDLLLENLKNNRLLRQLQPQVAVDGTLILTGTLSTPPPPPPLLGGRTEPVGRRNCRERGRSVANDSRRHERNEQLVWDENLGDWELSRKTSKFYYHLVLSFVSHQVEMVT